MSDMSVLKIPVRAKHTVAFHYEITQNQDIYNLICERELPAEEKCLKHSATASKQKEKQSSHPIEDFIGFSESKKERIPLSN